MITENIHVTVTKVTFNCMFTVFFLSFFLIFIYIPAWICLFIRCKYLLYILWFIFSFLHDDVPILVLMFHPSAIFFFCFTAYSVLVFPLLVYIDYHLYFINKYQFLSEQTISNCTYIHVLIDRWHKKVQLKKITFSPIHLPLPPCWPKLNGFTISLSFLLHP